MSDPPESRLTDYEAEQVRRIAAWKAERPRRRPGLLAVISKPLARLVDRLVPDAAAREAIDRAYDVSELTAGRDDIRQRAGVSDLVELRHRPLEECDRLAEGVGAWARGTAAAEGAATGAGGLLTSALDIPLLFGLAVRTILRIGYCYGEVPDRPEDRRLVLGILLIAATGDPEQKRLVVAQGRDVEHWLLEQGGDAALIDEPLEALLQLQVFDAIPGLGALVGGYQNYAFLDRVAVAARRVFQERWLRANGKVGAIEPAAGADRPRAGLAARAAYCGSYYLGFGVTLPVWLVARALAPMDNAVMLGLRDGASAATAGADRVLGRPRGAPAPDRETPTALPAPA